MAAPAWAESIKTVRQFFSTEVVQSEIETHLKQCPVIRVNLEILHVPPSSPGYVIIQGATDSTESIQVVRLHSRPVLMVWLSVTSPVQVFNIVEPEIRGG